MSDEGGSGATTDRPHPNTLSCADCGHVWFAGERRHAYLDDGAVLCVLCLQRRRLEYADEPS